MARVTDYLTRDQIRELVTPSDARGALSVAYSWSVIAAAMTLVAFAPNAFTVLLALVLIGGQQLGLAILTHETTHDSLFRSKALNRFFGTWLCGAPVWLRLEGYRAHHLQHHSFTGTDRDPDIGLATPFPTSRGSLARKLLRDVTGIAAFKRIFGLLLMDFGFIEYTVSDKVQWLERQAWHQHVSAGLRSIFPFLLTNGVLLGILVGLGRPELYLLWVGAWLTTYGLFIRVRAIAEHAVTELSDNPLQNTRTTESSWLARLTVCPHQVNYHLEHHLLMTVPHYRLAAMHALLRKKGAFDAHNHAPGYLAVLRMATSPRG